MIRLRVLSTGRIFPSMGIISLVRLSLLWFGKGREIVRICRKKLVTTAGSVAVVVGSRGTMGKLRCELENRMWMTPKEQSYQYMSCY